MKIEVRFRGFDDSPTLRQHAITRVHSHINHFGPEVTSVLVRIDDVNGPKGGLDMRCRCLVRGPRLGSTIAEEISADPYAGVDAAVERVGQTLRRHLERLRTQDSNQGGVDKPGGGTSDAHQRRHHKRKRVRLTATDALD